ncbi:MAG: type II toxin-antitoxin system VapC family toxin [Anaerolineae bacterium]|nr:type II toxin-antitoxin system VapC family toxin [Anaerolineae bacterium]MDW8098245.1 type II toxin-antitoxin system VapC family toxin [Anaerolineae bacterium]
MVESFSGMMLLDADVCVHAVMPASPAREACAWVMSEIAHGRLSAAIDVEVVREILDRLGRAGARDKARQLVESLMEIVPIQFPLEARDLQLAADFCRMPRMTHLRPSGCIHLAIMQRHGLSTILSLDPAYDGFPNVIRLNPQTLYKSRSKA